MRTQLSQADELAAWLRRNAIPLSLVDAGRNTKEMQSLESVLHGVRIVGFGESTHGTREFFQIRFRCLQFLVVEMGFTVLAIEGSYFASQAINDYILKGIGDKYSILNGIASVMWNVEEFAEVLDWLREYNQSATDAAKVHVFGLSMFHTQAGRQHVLAYLRSINSEQAGAAAEIFRSMAVGEASGLLRAHEHIDHGLLAQLCQLADHLGQTRSMCPTTLRRATEAEQATRYVQVMTQWLRINITDRIDDELPQSVPRMRGLNNFARSKYMADNVTSLLSQHPQARVAIWAHNFHIGAGFEDSNCGWLPTMGTYLRERFAADYYAFGLEFDRGTYLAREWLPDNTLGDLRIGAVSSPQ